MVFKKAQLINNVILFSALLRFWITLIRECKQGAFNKKAKGIGKNTNDLHFLSNVSFKFIIL